MTLKAIITTTITLTALLGGQAFADSHGNDLVHARTFKGETYTMNQTHMSLYTYDRDQAGVSNCYGDCAANWPPALLQADAELGENYTLIPRTDGTMQIAYKNKPLYLWANDKNIGDRGGDGVGGVWRLSRP